MVRFMSSIFVCKNHRTERAGTNQKCIHICTVVVHKPLGAVAILSLSHVLFGGGFLPMTHCLSCRDIRVSHDQHEPSDVQGKTTFS